MTFYDELDKAQLNYLQLLIDAGCKIRFKTLIPRGDWALPRTYVCMTGPQGGTFFEKIPDDIKEPSYGPYTVDENGNLTSA